ncbi:MAG TPA: class I SAM-dependent methyltransferase [Gaiellaceae bacterium]|nr:class I SAM-dependent methyltransferase [Gaiellaceae bacterium]
MTRVVDGEGAHLAAITRAADFRDRRVLEIGGGDGRLTWGFAPSSRSVLVTDPDAESIAAARESCPAELQVKVRFKVASAAEIELDRETIDLVFFSWSL